MTESTLLAGRDTPLAGPAPSGISSGRLVSLDVFRGITIAAMLLVNNPGSWSNVYPPLLHAEWHGWTPTDLIFPFFLFIVGVSMTFSFGSAMERGVSREAVMRKAAVRSAKLVALGLVLHAFPWWRLDLETLRIPGVLQRIGVAFLIASVIVLWTGRRGRAIATALLLFGYWAAMKLVPVPGIGAGVLEPGRDLGAYIDRAVFGTAHLWSQARTWDPEGLLSTLPAVATVLLGVFTGDWLRSTRAPAEKVRGMLAAGAVAIAIGLLWGLVFPINKPLWTSSYVVFTAGAALLVLALCYASLDVAGHRRWGFPFLLFGVNAIAAFFLSSLVARIIGMPFFGGPSLKAMVYGPLYTSWLSPHNASLAFALSYVLLWTVVMWGMYRARVFWKV
jgi:predicted acyltransferase